jgi:type IV secretory pathway VirJ component
LAKKEPSVRAHHIETLLQHYQAKYTFKQIILAGFSFGANILQFAVNKSALPLQSKLTKLLLFSPCKSIDF